MRPCLKKEETLLREDCIISALVGLAGACGSNPKTEDTDRVVLESLAAPLLHPEWDGEALDRVAQRVRAEKYAVSPGCAHCAAPCGNTSDYDMCRLEGARAEIRSLKRRLLAALQRMAAQHEEPPAGMEFFYKALAYVGYDVEEAPLLALVEKAERMARETGRNHL